MSGSRSRRLHSATSPSTGRWHERDHSGYRRYDAAAVVELIRIRTLAEAGVPLSRVQELLTADEDEFAAAIEDIDSRLRAEIRERRRHRERVAQLAAGDRLALPPEAVEYLDRLRELDLPERAIEMERDAWILVAVQIPNQMPTLMAIKRHQIEDPAVTAIYLDLIEAADWDADDPRLPAIADRLVAMIETDAEYWREDQATDFALDDELVALLDEVFINAVPFARRLLRLLEERGWTGWTQLERIAPRRSRHRLGGERLAGELLGAGRRTGHPRTNSSERSRALGRGRLTTPSQRHPSRRLAAEPLLTTPIAHPTNSAGPNATPAGADGFLDRPMRWAMATDPPITTGDVGASGPLERAAGLVDVVVVEELG